MFHSKTGGELGLFVQSMNFLQMSLSRIVEVVRLLQADSVGMPHGRSYVVDEARNEESCRSNRCPLVLQRWDVRYNS